MQQAYAYILTMSAVGALLAGLIINAGTIAKPFKPFFRWCKSFIDMPMALDALQLTTQFQIDEINRNLRDMKMKSLARTIADPKMPIDERYRAGVEYIDLGGNGGIKCLFNEEIVHEYTEWLKARNGVK